MCVWYAESCWSSPSFLFFFFFLSAAMKKFPLAKLRLEIAVIKCPFVECRRSTRRKWKEASRTRGIKVRHFYGVFLVACMCDRKGRRGGGDPALNFI